MWYKIIFLLILFQGYGQDNTWTAFFDANNIRGFKDAEGKVMIEPKFSGLTHAVKFDKIIAVMEAKDYKMYYLLKNGRQIGHDSVWTLDTTLDCESEGLIKFSGKDGSVGMFNGSGKVAIPAQYNALSPCRNGYIMALKGAEKSYWHKQEEGGCNHWGWKGGTDCLINAQNKVLVENFNTESYIDFYSAQVTSTSSAEAIRVSYKTTDGNYLSFIDFNKQFEQFLKQDILTNLTPENLVAHSYTKIIFWDDNGPGWTGQTSADFITQNFDAIKKSMLEIKKPGAEYWVSIQDVIICPDDMNAQFDAYRANCGGLDTSKYPLMEIIINHEGKQFSQDNFQFLKTRDGYKLLSVTLRDGK
ncbi:MAG: WG repeat-containing protein [Bacteroidota bacterium]